MWIRAVYSRPAAPRATSGADYKWKCRLRVNTHTLSKRKSDANSEWPRSKPLQVAVRSSSMHAACMEYGS